MKMISICIITKNDASYLQSMFNNINKQFKDIDYEVVIVDMNSTDETKEISAKYTDKIYDYMEDNVIEARKLALKQCEADWILYLEPDEMVKEFDSEIIREITSSDNNVIGVIEVVNQNTVDGITTSYNIKEERIFNKNSFSFSDDADILIASNEGIEITNKQTGIEVNKVPYTFEKDEAKKKQKIDKKISDLMSKVEENPEEPYNYFLIGMAYKMLNDLEMARGFFLKGLEFPINPNAAYTQIMVVVYGNILLDLEEYEEALLLENVYDLFDGIADFLCLMGQIYLRTGFIAEAIREYTKATNTLGCIEKRSRDIVPNYNLGCIYEVLGDIEIAKKLYARCGDYSKAKERLEQLN